MNRRDNHIYAFGTFRLDEGERILWRDGSPISLTPKAFETLLVLVRNSGHLVGKNDLINAVWPDTCVEEGNLTNNISVLRKILGDDSATHHYIETVPKLGYRFVADVTEMEAGNAKLVFENHTLERITTEKEEFPEVAVRAEAAPLGSNKSTPHTVKAKRIQQGLAGFTVATLLVMAAVAVYRGYMSQVPNETTRFPSVAVLPFKSLENDEADALGLKLADALILRLGRLQQIIVRPTRAIQGYAGRAQDPLAAGREQQVDVVLDGSFQRAGERLRISARLLRTNDGQQLWAGVFDENGSDPFALQDGLAEQTAQALLPQLSGAEIKLLARRDTYNVEANRLYTEARYHWNKRNIEGLQKSVELLKQALALDPKYARAHAAMADAYITLGDYEILDAREAYPKAREAALRALALDDTLAEAHTALAMIKASYEWNWSAAEQAFKQAIEKNPHYPTAHQWYAEFLAGMQRHDEALEQIHWAQQLDPLSPIIRSVEAWILYYAREYDKAIAHCQRVIALTPNFGEVYIYLARAYEQKGMFKEAMDAFQRHSTLIGYNTPEATAIRASAILDSRDYWRKRNQLGNLPGGSMFDSAEALAQLGETDQALDLLEQAYIKRDFQLMYLKVHPNFDPLRQDHRFGELLRRVGHVQ